VPGAVVTFPRGRLHVVLIAALVAAGPAAAWAQPAVDCRADPAGQRVLLRVSLVDLFDQELLRLVQLGLQGRLRIKATLYRPRRFWFDARVVESSRQLAVSWSREEGVFTVEGRPVEHPSRLVLPEMIVGSGLDEAREEREGYVEVEARLEVITASSLGQVARWLVRGSPGRAPGASSQPAESSSPLLPRALVEYLAADLARTTSGRCSIRRARRAGR
jgi:hypothetical protein